MASSFTPAQKAAIRNFLGWSELYHDIDPRLESQLISLPTNHPEAADRVIANLTALAAIDTKLQCSALNNLDVKVAEEVEFLGPVQLDALRDQGRMLIKQIAITFFLEPMRDYYETGPDISGLIQLG